MAQGKKTDIYIKTRVIEEKINNPSMSSRDISLKLQEEGKEVSNDTVCDIINADLPRLATESEYIGELVTRNNRLSSLADVRLLELLAKDEPLRPIDLVSIRESAFKQNQLLSGKATENTKITIEWAI